MIAKEEADGLLAEADEAEKTGRFVLLTPEYTRYVINLLAQGKRLRDALVSRVVVPNETAWNGTQWQCKLCGAVSLENTETVQHSEECVLRR